MKAIIIVLVVAILGAGSVAGQSPATKRIDPTAFRAGYDIPVGVEHGTWDFDEWPGVDHGVVYIENYMYNSFPNERIKIDYFRSLFDEDDHRGYLRTPADLRAKGFLDMEQVLQSAQNRTLLGIFCHPDDEVLLAGGLLVHAAALGWNVQVILLSNGADGSSGSNSEPDPGLGGYNSFSIARDGAITVTTDKTGLRKLDIIAGYAKTLGISIQVLTVDLTLDGKRLVQLGEAPGLDFPKSFGPGSEARGVIQDSLWNILGRTNAGVILTHGKNGEYGNYLHKLANDLVLALSVDLADETSVFTCFPEYNEADHITHFLDLDGNGKNARNTKTAALKKISFLFDEAKDFDKPWDPNDTLMDGAFVKDYGYTPLEGVPPRYEYFQKVK